MSLPPVPVSLRRPVRRPVGDASGALVDRFDRVHRDLRISVTDRCNLRCTYCLPEDDVEHQPRASQLDFDEIARVASVAKSMGIENIRLTGGEPLVRTDLHALVAALADIGFADLSMTTNAMLLAPRAKALADAGLDRVTVSCDSLDPARFAAIRRRGDLATVLEAMDLAEAAGLGPVKVNVVLVAGQNEDEIVEFARFARVTGRTVRFIEFMPLDAPGRWERPAVVSGQRVLDEIAALWPLEAISEGPLPSSAPAERFRFTDGGGEIGIIRSVTAPFCGTCDRLRLTTEGSLRNCLFSDDEISLRPLLRAGCTDEELRAQVHRSVSAKRSGHGIDDPSFVRPSRPMSSIGG